MVLGISEEPPSPFTVECSGSTSTSLYAQNESSGRTNEEEEDVYSSDVLIFDENTQGVSWSEKEKLSCLA